MKGMIVKMLLLMLEAIPLVLKMILEKNLYGFMVDVKFHLS